MSVEVVSYLLIAVIMWGVSPVFDKLVLRYFEPFQAFYVRALVMVVVCFVFILTRFSYTINSLLTVKWYAGLYVLMSVITAMIGVFAYLKAMNFSQASKIVPLSSTYPLVTFIIAVIFLGENVTLTKILGTIFIILGIFLISR